MSAKKCLIIPGMPRAGTTFLFQLLSGYPDVFNIPARKETNAFYTARSEQDFLSWFGDADPLKRYLDVSPAYFVYPSSVIDRMAELLGDWDVRLVVCLRHPVHMAYSHYLYRVSAHMAPKCQHRDVSLGFYEAGCRDWLWLWIKDHIDKLLQYFGRERIFVLPYPGAFRKAGDDWSALSAFLGCDLAHAPTLAKVNAGGRLPYYLYTSKPKTHWFAGQAVELPAGTLVLVNGDKSQVWFGIDRTTGLEIVNKAQWWTKRLSAQEVDWLYENEFKADFEGALAALGLANEGFETTAPIETEAAIPGQAIFDAVNRARARRPVDPKQSRFMNHLR